MFSIGDRVVTPIGNLGHIEQIDPDGIFCDVRLLTPRNEPSCCLAFCHVADLVKAGDNVVPMPRPPEWYAEADSFIIAILTAIQEEL
jgi:hypothetical protein